MNRSTRKQSILRTTIICLFIFLSLFSISGYEKKIHYNEVLTVVMTTIFFIRPLFYKSTLASRTTRRLRLWFAILLFVFISTTIILGNGLLTITNFITVFGIVAWSEYFSLVKWDSRYYFAEGIAISAFSLVLMAMILPGQVLSGWNPNSSIVFVSPLLLGISLIILSNSKLNKVVIIILLTVAVLIMFRLRSRSTILGIIIFLILAISKSTNNKKRYRLLYSIIIGLNVLIPIMNRFILTLSFAKSVNHVLSLIAEGKNDIGYNGRDYLWINAIQRVSENPFFGELGKRPFYSHNFSTDVLLEFGWVGWVIFVYFLIRILEECYSDRKEVNIIILAFLATLFANTFENLIAGNDYITVFPYVVLGVSLSIKSSLDSRLEVK